MKLEIKKQWHYKKRWREEALAYLLQAGHETHDLNIAIEEFLFLIVHVRKEKGEAENPNNRVGKIFDFH